MVDFGRQVGTGNGAKNDEKNSSKNDATRKDVKVENAIVKNLENEKHPSIESIEKNLNKNFDTKSISLEELCGKIYDEDETKSFVGQSKMFMEMLERAKPLKTNQTGHKIQEMQKKLESLRKSRTKAELVQNARVSVKNV